MTHPWLRRVLGLGGLCAAVSLAVAADGPAAADPLPPDLAAKVIADDIAMLQKDIGKADKVKLYALKGTAMMIALHAQNNMEGADADKNAALRDQALKLAGAIAKKDKAAMKSAADGLSTPTGGAKTPVDIVKQHDFDIAEAMSPFKKAPRGQNIEADIRTQAKNVTDVEKAGALGVRSALYGEFAAALKPADKAKPGSAQERLWDSSSKDMIALGREIAAEAAKGAKADKAVLKTKLAKLDAACTACHNEFK